LTFLSFIFSLYFHLANEAPGGIKRGWEGVESVASRNSLAKLLHAIFFAAAAELSLARGQLPDVEE